MDVFTGSRGFLFTEKKELFLDRMQTIQEDSCHLVSSISGRTITAHVFAYQVNVPIEL
jgi:hypothetical protein